MSMLKPCPRCGSSKYVVMDNNTWFFCRDCGWSCKPCRTLDEAIKAWNGVGEQSTVDGEQGEGNG